MKQVCMGRTSVGNNNNTLRACPFGQASTGTIETVSILGIAGTISEFWAELSATLTGVQTQSVSLVSATGGTICTVSFATGNSGAPVQATFSPYTIADGEQLYIERTATGSPAAMDIKWSFVWEGTNSGEAWAASSVASAPSTVTTYYPIWGSMNSTTVTHNGLVLTTNITINRIFARQTLLPVGGSSYEHGLYIDDVKQTGAGGTAGTVDTRMTANSVNLFSVTGMNLAVTSTKRVCWGSVPSGSPGTNARHSYAIAYTPAVDGQSIMGWVSQTNLNNSGDTYAPPGGATQSATESDRELTNHTSVQFGVDAIAYMITTATGASKSRTWTLRKNQASTGISIGPFTSGNAFSTFTAELYNQNDDLTILFQNVNTPNTTRGLCTLRQYIAPSSSGQPFMLRHGGVPYLAIEPRQIGRGW